MEAKWRGTPVYPISHSGCGVQIMGPNLHRSSRAYAGWDVAGFSATARHMCVEGYHPLLSGF